MLFGHLLWAHLHDFLCFFPDFIFLSRIIVFKLLIINFEIIILIWSIIEVKRGHNRQKHGRLRLLQPAERKGARVEDPEGRYQLGVDELAHAYQSAWWADHAAVARKVAPLARCWRQRPTNQEVQYADWPKRWSTEQDDLEHAEARQHPHGSPWQWAS